MLEKLKKKANLLIKFKTSEVYLKFLNSLMALFLIISILLIQSESLAVIYGTDDRKETEQFPNLKTISKSIAVAVPRHFVSAKSDGRIQILDWQLLAGSSTANTCSEEKFANQPTVGNCTGFLITDRLVLTAGHCVMNRGVIQNDSNSDFCRNFVWMFDYNLKNKSNPNLNSVPAESIYTCQKIIYAEVVDNNDGRSKDYAIIELSKVVSKSFQPLKLNKAKPSSGMMVANIGHSAGLPAKHSGYSQITNSKHPDFFETYFDVQSGASGGPVLNMNNQVVGILVSGYQMDFYQSNKGCYKWNRCDSLGLTCLRSATNPSLQKSNYVQRLEPIFEILSGYKPFMTEN